MMAVAQRIQLDPDGRAVLCCPPPAPPDPGIVSAAPIAPGDFEIAPITPKRTGRIVIGWDWIGIEQVVFPFPTFPAPQRSPAQYRLEAFGCDEPLPLRNINLAAWNLCFSTHGTIEINAFGSAANVQGAGGVGNATLALWVGNNRLVADFVEGNRTGCAGHVTAKLNVIASTIPFGLGMQLYTAATNAFLRGPGGLICCGEGSYYQGINVIFTPD